MVNPFLESPSHLRREWKALRLGLGPELSDEQHLALVAKWWAQAPVSKAYLDWDRTHTWPNPWELITSRTLDNSAIALGMSYTLLLCNDGRWTPERVQLVLACDLKKTMQHLIVMIDSSWILNQTYASVNSVDGSLMVQNRYSFDGKKYISDNSSMVG